MKVWTYTSKSRLQLLPGTRKAELDQTSRERDIVSLYCPLTESTCDLVSARRLELMKLSAILTSTSRDSLINEQDLVDALNNYKIYAAGLDVLSTELPRAGNPLLTARNCYITPYIVWATSAARERLMTILIDDLKTYIGGKSISNIAK